MHTESRGSRAVDSLGLERAIVLQLLRDDRAQKWSSAELGAEMGVEALVVEEALRRLQDEGVLCMAEGAVWVSSAACWLDRLGLIGI
jgi:DNA-binding GntR family transcriptional regulator